MLNQKRIRPLLVVVLYLFLTELYFLVGPIQWGEVNRVKLFVFLFFAKIMLILGYLYGERKRTITKVNYFESRETSNFILLRWILCLAIVMNLIYIFFRTSSLSPSAVLSKIVSGITNPSANYLDKFNAGTSLYYVFSPLYTISGLLTFSATPLSIYYYKNLSGGNKLLAIINLLVEVSRWLIVGTNKGLVDIVLIIASVYFLKSLLSPRDRKQNTLKSFFLKIIIILIVLIILNYFLKNINGRLQGNTTYMLLSLKHASFKSTAFWRNISATCFALLVYSQAYLTQGYYGLGLALDAEFHPMYGIGFSNFLTSNVSNFVDDNFLNRSLLVQVEDSTGWSSTVNWHTAYTWFANDCSFIGCVFLMFIIGYYFSRVVDYALSEGSPIYISLFVIMMIMFFYFPMNNQIFNMPNQFMGFIGLNFAWILKKKNITIAWNRKELL